VPIYLTDMFCPSKREGRGYRCEWMGHRCLTLVVSWRTKELCSAVWLLYLQCRALLDWMDGRKSGAGMGVLDCKRVPFFWESASFQ
jgi:hypothetical protein